MSLLVFRTQLFPDFAVSIGKSGMSAFVFQRVFRLDDGDQAVGYKGIVQGRVCLLGTRIEGRELVVGTHHAIEIVVSLGNTQSLV